MAIYGQSLTVAYYCYNSSTNAAVTGDASNHTLKLLKDGTEATATNTSTEIDSTNMPGWYKLVLTSTEMSFNCIVVGGKSSTSNALIVGPTFTTDQGTIPGGHAAGANGGLPTVDASNQVKANVTAWNGTAVATPNVAGVPLVDIGYVKGTASAGTAGYMALDWAHITGASTTVNLSGTTIATVTNAVTLSTSDGTTIVTGTAQAGASTSITLANTSSSVTNFYVGDLVKITGGTGANQIRRITAYNASTFVATVSRPWATNPDATSTYAVLYGDGPALDSNLYVTANSVTSAITLPTIPSNWITAAGIAASALNGKGDWLLSSSYTAPDNSDIAAIKTQTDKLTFDGSNNLNANVQATASALTFNLTGNITGNLSGSVSSVTAAVTVGTINTDAISAAAVSSAAVTKIQAGLSTYAGGDTSGTTTLLSRLTSARAGYLDNLNVGGLVSTQAEVNALMVNSRVVRVVPDVIEIPASGTDTRIINLYTYSTTGAALDADSAPTLTLVNESGADVSSRLSSTTMTRLATGQYQVTYTASSTDPEEQLVWNFTVSLGGVSSVYPNQTQVSTTVASEFTSTDRTHLTAIYNALPGGTLSSLTAANVWTYSDRELTAFTFDVPGITGVTFPTHFGLMLINGSGQVQIDGSVSVTGTVVLDASQPNYAPAKAGDKMDLVNVPNPVAVAAIQSGLATASSLTAVATNVTAIKTQTDKMIFDGSSFLETNVQATASSLTFNLTGNITGNLVGTVSTVTTLTNLPAITPNWLTATGIAAAALNGKGDWLTSASYTAPDNTAIAAIKAQTDKLSFDGSNNVLSDPQTAVSVSSGSITSIQSGLATSAALTTDTNSILAAVATRSSHTPGDIWDVTRSAHTASGTFGELWASFTGPVIRFFQAIMRKDVTAPTDLGGTYSPSADSLQAIVFNGVPATIDPSTITAAVVTALQNNPVSINPGQLLSSGIDGYSLGSLGNALEQVVGAAGDYTRVRLTYTDQGNPIPGVIVIYTTLADPHHPIAVAESDAGGVATRYFLHGSYLATPQHPTIVLPPSQFTV